MRVLRVLSAVVLLLAGISIVGAAPAAADEVTITYETGSAGDVSTSVNSFAEHVASTLDHPEGWSLGGSIDWVAVEDGGDVRILIAEPSTIGAIEGCSAQYSCHVSGTVYINEDRWRSGADGWHRSIDGYRHYVVNHEVGHFLELDHVDCPGAGQAAPVMMQQTIQSEPCENRVWPLRYERERVADRYGVVVREASEQSLQFVRAAYLRTLSRLPSDRDAELLARRLDRGEVSEAEIVDSMWASGEFAAVTAPVGRLYYATFLRPADPDGLYYWTDQVQEGRSLSAIAGDMARSEEFEQRYGDLDDGEFIERLYLNVLGRQPDDEGHQYWTEKLRSGELTRGEVVNYFAQSDEHRTRRAVTITVSLAYPIVLDRLGDSDGIDYWERQLEGDARRIDMIHTMLGSDEAAL